MFNRVLNSQISSKSNVKNNENSNQKQKTRKTILSKQNSTDSIPKKMTIYNNKYPNENGSTRQSHGKVYYGNYPRDNWYGDSNGSCRDEQKLHRLLARLEREEDSHRLNSNYQQIADILSGPDSQRLASQHSKELKNTFETILQQKPSIETHKELILTITSFGVASGKDIKFFFEWLFSLINTSSRLEIIKIIVQVILRMLKKNKRIVVMTRNIPLIMDNVLSALENAYSAEVLLALSELAVYISQNFPQDFAVSFKDIMDILIGWQIEVNQSPHFIHQMSKVLSSFHMFWFDDLNFSLGLMVQFLEDLEGFAEIVKKKKMYFYQNITNLSTEENEETKSKNEEIENLLKQMDMRIGVFSTVLKGLVDFSKTSSQPSREYIFDGNFLLQSIKRLFRSIEVLKDYYRESFLTQANECLAILLKNGASDASQVAPLISDYLVTIYPNIKTTMSTTHILSILNLMGAYAKEIEGSITESFIKMVFAPNRWTQDLRTMSNSKITEAHLKLQQNMLLLKRIPLLELAYKNILLDMQMSLEVLIPSSNLKLVENMTSDVVYDKKKAEVALLADICILSELSNTKYSIIGLWLLKPSYFDLLAQHLAPIYNDLMDLYPNIHYSLLYSLYSHCHNHEHYVFSSELISNQGNFKIPRPTLGYLSIILELVSTTLIDQKTSRSCRLLMASWSQELMETIQSNISKICSNEEFCKLIEALANLCFLTDTAICQKSCSAILSLLKYGATCVSEEFLNKCFEVSLLKIPNPDKRMQSNFITMLAALPLDITTRQTLALSRPYTRHFKMIDYDELNRKEIVKPQDIWGARRALMARVESPTFISAHTFKKVMAYILNGSKDSDNMEWIVKLYQREGGNLIHLMEQHDSLAWFWSTWEVAHACVAMRLRTPLGKPQDTFTTIEGAIKSYAKSIVKNDKKGWKDGQYLRPRLLIDLTEHLEKLLYNAYEGCAISIINPPKAVRTFFRTNKATCLEWIRRIRMAVMLVALKTGQLATVVRQGYQLLHELGDSQNTKDFEFERVIMYIVQALIGLGSSETILGLYVWARDHLDLKLTWIKAAVDQAAGRYENSAFEYSCVLHSLNKKSASIEKDNRTKSPEPSNEEQQEHQLQGYLIHQVKDCHMKLGNWTDAKRWATLQNETYNKENLNFTYCFGSPNDEEYIKYFSLIEGEELDYSMMKDPVAELSSWDSLLLKEELTIMKTVSSNNFAKDEIKKDLQSSYDTIKSLIKMGSSEWPPSINPYQIIACAPLCNLYSKDIKLIPGMVRNGFKLDPAEHNCGILNHSLNFLKIHQLFDGQEQAAAEDLQLVVSRLARKQQNLKLSQKLILQSLKEKDSNFSDALFSTLTLPSTEKLLRLQREGAKTLYSLGNCKVAVDLLLESATSILGQPVSKSITDLNARTLLTLSKYLQVHPNLHQECNTSETVSKLIALYNPEASPAIPITLVDPDNNIILSSPEEVHGALLKLSVNQMPELPKSWSVLASWAYHLGCRAINSNEGTFELDSQMKQQITSILNEDLTEEQMNSIYTIIGSVSAHSEVEERDLEMDNPNQATESVLKVKLLEISPLFEDEIKFKQLMDIRNKVWNSVYRHHETAAKAYFQYLRFEGDGQRFEDDKITATLRILRIVVKHAAAMRDILEEGLANTPTTPWRGIIPQLFSRLNHPEPYVRERISDLLCRVAHDSSHLIVFPTIVGSLTSGFQNKTKAGLLKSCFTKDTSRGEFTIDLSEEEEEYSESEISPEAEDKSEEDDEEEEEDEQEQQKAAMLQISFTALANTLGKQENRTIEEVKVFVTELRRITLLWEELWLGTLSVHLSDTTKRITNLVEEINKVQPSLKREVRDTLIKEKYRVFLQPLLFILEQLTTISSQPSETPHEELFQKHFGNLISKLLLTITKPKNFTNPCIILDAYNKLHHALQNQVQQNSRSNLKMEDISPVLYSLQNTSIPMPGAKSGVTLKSVQNTVFILPSKTKPKKLAFHGSNGIKYTYLFKGLEDLHLDERVMQFISIVNNMFVKNKKHSRQVYRARHYSVTPLGPRSGLIQWVDHSTPMFGLYKRWQHRESTAVALKTPANSGTLRPSEIFYNKLTPLLNEKGITSIENRKEWPINILIQVLKELMDATPKDLLANELWCHSSSSSEWWKVIQTYNRSTAIMSMIGYIIGLGDRHLDNILVDLTTGEVVHIDYNVCFDKGRALRVPEKVPFRMTPNLETALGITGVEGTFRVSAEYVLQVLKRGKETLLTLLEAFVYDPLVDWTPAGTEGGYAGAMYGGRSAHSTRLAKQAMERDIVLSLFSIRITEMQSSWLKNKDDLILNVHKLEGDLNDWLTSKSQCEGIEVQLLDAVQYRTSLCEAMSNPTHSLYTLGTRQKEILKAKNQLETGKKDLELLLVEFKNKKKDHAKGLENICGPKFKLWYQSVSELDLSNSRTIASVESFLQNVTKGKFDVQCAKAEWDLKMSFEDLQKVVTSVLESLSSYSLVIGHYDCSFQENTKIEHWLKMVEAILADFSLSECQKSLSALDDKIEKPKEDTDRAKAVLAHLESALHKNNNIPPLEYSEVTEDDEFLQKEISALTKEKGQYILACVVINELNQLVRTLLQNQKNYNSDALVAHLMNNLVLLTKANSEHYNSHYGSFPPLPFQDIALEKCLIVLQSFKGVFSTLEELVLNFHAIIFPEAFKFSLNNEPSFIDTTNKFASLLEKYCVNSLIHQVEKLILSGTEGNVLKTVEALRVEYKSLVVGNASNHGEMLLMGLEGLFTKLNKEFAALLEIFSELNPSPIWQTINEAKDSINQMSFSLWINYENGAIKSLQFLKHLQLIGLFFTECKNAAALLQTPINLDVKLEEALLSNVHFKPLQNFVNNFVEQQLQTLMIQALVYTICALTRSLGIEILKENAENQALTDFIKLSFNSWLKDHACKRQQFSQMKSLVVEKLVTLWKTEFNKQQNEQKSNLCKGSCEHLKLQIARFQWMHEELLPAKQGSQRSAMMSLIKKNSIAISQSQEKLLDSQKRYAALMSSVEKRITWAQGSTPDLSENRHTFELEHTKKLETTKALMDLSQDVFNTCNYLLNFEAQRSNTAESKATRLKFYRILRRCEESFRTVESLKSSISSTEEKYLALLPLGENEDVTGDWLSKLLETISLNTVKDKLDKKNKNIKLILDCAKQRAVGLKGLLTFHHKLMCDLRNILRSMQRYEEQIMGSRGPVQEYLSNYKDFSDCISFVIRELTSEEVELHNLLSQLPSLERSIHHVYDKLVTLNVDHLKVDLNTRPTTLQNSKQDVEGSAPSRDPKTGKVVQEKNSYATNVLKRVKLKLEGREPDSNKKYSISEQVNHVIKEATKLDNLAVLYEGWTPWV